MAEVPDYRVVVAYDGAPHTLDDPYRFLPTLGEVDLHLINEGRHEQLWKVLGARVHRYDAGVTGTSFAVWAPSARAVRLKGDFNRWDGREHPMRQLGSSGVWELFLPDVGNGTSYKFAILGPDGAVAREGRPDGLLRRAAAGHLLGRLRVRLHVGRRRLDGARGPASKPVDRGDVGLRDAPRLLAARQVVRRAGRRAGPATSPTSASPTSS